MRCATIAVGALGMLLALPASATAATFTVTKTADTNVACTVGNCSLREAISAANAAAGDDEIVLPAGTYAITGATGDDANASGDLDVTGAADSLTILGAGAGVTTITGNDVDRVFHVRQFGLLDLRGVRVRDGRGQGGAIHNDDADASVRDSIIESNESTITGGAIYSNGTQRARVVIEDSTVRGNNAAGSGGAIQNDGESRTVVLGSRITGNVSGSDGGALLAQNASAVTIDSSVIDGNSAKDQGGGFAVQNEATLTITRSRITGNTTTVDGGGGVWAQNAAAVTIDGSTIAANRSLANDDVRAGGGGLWLQNDAVVDITNSTVSGNTAVRDGGGIWLRNFVYLTLVNSTVSGNTARSGGGIRAEDAPTIRIDSSTIAANRAATRGGGLDDGTSNVFQPWRLENTIVAANTAGAARSDCGGATAGGTFTSFGTNLDSTATCDLGAAGDRRNVNPRLGPLASNGGPTQTMALLAGSPAINAGSNDCPAADQRGLARPVGARCDIGAFEAPLPRAATPPPPVPGPDRIRPGLTALSLGPSAFRAAPRGASIAGGRPVGTEVRYRLSERAAVRFRVARATSGRRVGRRCVRRTRRNAGRRKCRRFVAVRGSFTHAGTAGANSFRFTGRVGGRRLRVARYRLTAVATDAARNRSLAARRNFRIVRR